MIKSGWETGHFLFSVKKHTLVCMNYYRLYKIAQKYESYNSEKYTLEYFCNVLVPSLKSESDLIDKLIRESVRKSRKPKREHMHSLYTIAEDFYAANKELSDKIINLIESKKSIFDIFKGSKKIIKPTDVDCIFFYTDEQNLNHLIQDLKKELDKHYLELNESKAIELTDYLKSAIKDVVDDFVSQVNNI